jgi:hypothetical protein
MDIHISSGQIIGDQICILPLAILQLHTYTGPSPTSPILTVGHLPDSIHSAYFHFQTSGSN